MWSIIISTILALIIAIFFAFLFIKTETQKKTKNVETQKQNFLYSKKQMLTQAEKVFLNKLNQCINADYLVQPQINLATIVKRTDNFKYQNELFRNIDFGIFSKSNYELKLLIELNDKTHFNKNKQYRDIRVNEICKAAGIPLIKFWANMPNEIEYLKNRINKYLN